MLRTCCLVPSASLVSGSFESRSNAASQLSAICHGDKRDFPAINSANSRVTLQHDFLNPQATEGTARVPCQLLPKETGDTEECGEHKDIAFIAVKVHASIYVQCNHSS